MTKPRCRECGDTKPLNASGVCAWRHGCEHRQFVHAATMARLEDEFRRLDFQVQSRRMFTESGHWGSYLDALERHPSNSFRPPLHQPERMNQWIDHWLLNPDDADEDDE